MTSRKPAAPSKGAGPSRGDRFWAAVQAQYEPGLVETVVLTEICRLLDRQDLLTVAIQRDGATVLGSTGQPRVHPAMAESRGHALTIGRLLAQLGIAENGEALASPESVQGRPGGEYPMVATAHRLGGKRRRAKGSVGPLA